MSAATLLLRVARASFARPALGLTATALSVAVALVAARDLRVDGDLVSLLPASAPSVQGLAAYEAKGGTVGYIALLFEGGTPEARRAHAARLAPALESLERVAYVEDRRPAAYFEDRGLYYLALEDLEDLADRVADRARYERRRANPLLVDLTNAPAPEITLDEAAARLPRGLARRPGAPRYEGDGTLMVLVKPAARASDLGFARAVVEDVQGVLRAHPDPEVTVALGGRFPKRVAQQAMLGADLRLVSGVAALLVLGYLGLYFRRPRDVVVVLAPLGVGLAWTFGLTAVVFGELNVLSAFAGTILVGLGIDHGLHLLTRYDAARREGLDARAALEPAFGDCGRAVLLAGLTTALGFAGLALTDFRAFREFGLVAALGGLLVLAAYLVVLPGLLRWRGGPATKTAAETTAKTAAGPTAGCAPALVRRLVAQPVPVLLVSTAGLMALVALAPRLTFDDDFAHLDPTAGVFGLDPKIDALLGRQQASVAIVTRDLDAAAQAALTLRTHPRAAGAGIDHVVTARDLVPTEQGEKQALLQEIAEDIRGLDPDGLPPDQRAAVERLRTMVAQAPFTLADLPASVRHELVLDAPGGGGLVLVYPSVRMSDGEAVVALAEHLSNVELPSGEVVSATGEAMVLADVLRLVFAATPRAVGATVVGVGLCLWLLLGRWRRAAMALVPATLAVTATLGAAHALGRPLDYLNVVFVPVLFGLAVDAGVHFATHPPRASGLARLAETSRAILGANLTTACGFGALLLAHHPGLRSLGALAVLGLATSTFVSLIWLPALWLSRTTTPTGGRGTKGGSCPPVEVV